VSNIFINRKRQKRIRKILILIVIFIAVVSIGIMLCIKAVSLNKNQNKVKAASYKPKTAKLKKVKIDTTKQIVSNSNVSEEGKKYTCDALEIQKIINEGKKQVDGRKFAFLTFDDGPSTTVTPKILNILKENNVHATFSLIGKEIEQNDESKAIVKQEIEQGNAIGNHSYSHNYKLVSNVAGFMDEINRTEGILRGILGDDFPASESPIWVRWMFLL
jgi:peptidoglycan/xylan/chitin deacetylase (PgdA/CDA1 family)